MFHRVGKKFFDSKYVVGGYRIDKNVLVLLLTHNQKLKFYNNEADQVWHILFRESDGIHNGHPRSAEPSHE